MQNKFFNSKTKTILIFLVIILVTLSLWYIWKKENTILVSEKIISNTDIKNSQNIIDSDFTKENSQLSFDSDSTFPNVLNTKENNIVVDNKKNIQIGPIKLLAPYNGEHITVGADYVIQYEITENLDNNFAVVGVGDCKETFNKKNKGVYSLQCKNLSYSTTLNQDTYGPTPISLGYIDFTSNPKNYKLTYDVAGEVFFDLPNGVEILSITTKPGVFEPVINVPKIQNSKETVAYVYFGGIFSDGISRSIPLSYFKYSIDDTSVVDFELNEETKNHPNFKFGRAVHLIYKKSGETTLRLEYKGLKAEVKLKSFE